MELVKKNIVSIVCGVVALVAVAAVFWPISGYYQELQSQVAQRKQVHDEFRNILSKERRMPVFTADSAEGVRLDAFPTITTIEKAKAVVDGFNKQAQGMFERAAKLNEHKLLVDGALTESPTAWAKFSAEYKRKLEMPNPQNPVPQPLPEYTIARQIMKAGFAPTDQEIANARMEEEAKIKALEVQGPSGIMNQAQVDAMRAERLPKVADELKLKAAEDCLVYLEPMAMDPSPLIMQGGGGGMPGMPGGIGPSVIFNAQVGLWIYEDVAKAIAAANMASNAADVRQSVVKHFVKFDVVDEPFKPLMPGGGMGMGGEGGPVAPNNDPTQPITPTYDWSPTGRVSNGIYDVVPFDLRIVVDATQIPRVLTELSRGRFITVTNVSMNMVDSALKKSEGYYYGDNPVVELQIRCEALFLRKWTEPLMPLPIKQALGLAPAPVQPGFGQ